MSPYLLQHRDNPVWWHPWSDAAFEEARTLNRPVFLSIGYSTCYWCHVMEKEAFEDDEVAAALNESFVSIKVDREERPDVDQIYMDAVIAISGHGGWPMSVFLTPDRKPFWAATYIPKLQFLSVLSQIGDLWKTDPERVGKGADQITARLREHEFGEQESGDVSFRSVAHKGATELLENFDERDGGFGTAPKFPPSQQLRALLRARDITPDLQIDTAVTLTLNRMASAGLYDQLGGGFSRYSTDDAWIVPHFEKMLYDNALLATTYFEASEQLGEPSFAKIGEETLEYLVRDMKDPESGAFYAAQDAGEVDKEGEYYVWQFDELTQLLSKDAFADLRTRFVLSEQGNFEGLNIFVVQPHIEWAERWDPSVRKQLLEVRREREAPHRDEKILTAWNALALSAFVLGGEVLSKQSFREQALAVAHFLTETAWQERELCVSYAGGERRGKGCLDDYVFTIGGLIALYESSEDLKWLDLAAEMQGVQNDLLWREEHGVYAFSAASDLIVERRPLFDGALPSANGRAIANLRKLSLYTEDLSLRELGGRLLQSFHPLLSRAPSAVGSALISLYEWEYGGELVVAFGKDESTSEPLPEKLLEALSSSRIRLSLHRSAGDSIAPFLQGKDPVNGETTYYLCREGRCEEPTTDVGEIIILSANKNA